MSEIIIPNAKLPTDCFTCDYEELTENCPCHIGVCSASEYKDNRHPDCPLKEVPTHGDLIDRQKLLEHRFEVYDSNEELCEDYIETYHVLEAPAIIEASK